MKSELFSVQPQRLTDFGIDAVCLDNQGRVCGQILASKQKDIALVTKHFVYRELRRQGVGSLLLDAVETWGREKGMKRILNVGFICDAETPLAYIRAVHYYRRRGYSYRGIGVLKHL